MNGLEFADGVIAKIRARDGQFHERAYLFVLAAVEFLQGKLPARRHVSGAELAWACRDLAQGQWGLMAPSVLGYWGIRSTLDIGRIVYTLVDVGLLVTQPGDKLDDFAGVFDFDDAFRSTYEWQGVPTA